MKISSQTLTSIALLTLGLTACSESGPEKSGRAFVADQVANVLDWETRIDAEENDSILNVLPDVNPDLEGGFLIADQGEQQVRGYSRDGSLKFHFGMRGDGPREFRHLQTAIRLTSRQILTLEADGGFKILSEDGTRLIETFSLGRFRRASQVMSLTDSTVLVAARLAEALDGPQLHVVDVKRQKVVKSFFQPFANASSRTAAFAAGWVGFDIRNDTVAATFSVSDSVFYFDTEGTSLGRVCRRWTTSHRCLPSGPTTPRSWWTTTATFG